MEEEPSPLLLQRYRRDRRKLLEFILFERLDAAPASPLESADVDLDAVSADYVLECVQSGVQVDPVEATRRHFEALEYPIMINSLKEKVYFLQSRPELSGSPPQRTPPLIQMKTSANIQSSSPGRPEHSVERETGKLGGSDGVDQAGSHAELVKKLSLGLPAMCAGAFSVELSIAFRNIEGLSDDNMRETAFEVLFASFVLSGRQENHKKGKEKMHGVLSGPSSKRRATNSQPESHNGDILEMIRIQLEISEATVAVTKRGLSNLSSQTIHAQLDVPHISLELLGTISSSDFPNQRSYTRWLMRQANILEELLCSQSSFVSNVCATLKKLLSDLKDPEKWGQEGGPDSYTKILTAIESYATKLSCLPGKFGITDETYYWTGSYHFNIRLYEKLLSSIFDVLEDGQIIEEEEEILTVIRMTWSILGITPKIHDALYIWVLFQQFVSTGELTLLKRTVPEVHKVLSDEDSSGVEEAYMKYLSCTYGDYGNSHVLKLVDAVLFNIFLCCHNQLMDYHLMFNQDETSFEIMLELGMLSVPVFVDEFIEIKYIRTMAGTETVSRLVHLFVERSIEAAYRRAFNSSVSNCKIEDGHYLVTLASQVKLIIKKEYAAYSPILCRHYPEAGMLAPFILHQLYGEELKPFLEKVTHLSQSTKKVLAAADSLEHYLAHTFNSAFGGSKNSSLIQFMDSYQIKNVSAPLILDWVQAQHDNILQWTRRAAQIEDWQPLTRQQFHAASVVEIFRIIEETVEQFFNLNIPMETIHLRALISGVSQSLETYLGHIVNQQVNKNVLYPNFPPLTRYGESTGLFAKKKTIENPGQEEKIISQLDDLTASKLCVKLNTIHYIREQLDILEETIKQSWLHIHSGNFQHKEVATEYLSTFTEPVDELFTIFDDIRRTAIDTSDLIVEFIGVRVIFWDLRDSFLSSLYYGSAANSRLANFIPILDETLNHVCNLITDALRDQVVSSILRASVEGYTWVILNGGPARVFSDPDVSMMEEDMNMLKEFFLANGQGLPEVVVHEEAKLAQQILGLYALKAETIIEMLMSASEQNSTIPESAMDAHRCTNSTDTLLRVLCHKKDPIASRFLKLHYQLPKSSDYEDRTTEAHTDSPRQSQMGKRSISFNWTAKGQRNFRVMKKKILEARHEIKRAT